MCKYILYISYIQYILNPIKLISRSELLFSVLGFPMIF
ncbi:hypothetical protein M124_3107 [Bacteroides fragilis str. 3988T(B)14]|uniref:Uncharacterized protein n=1 Tax=Bacteroides fragilis str. 3988T(B)14 TaxID=1339315 RepID=A0A015UGG9_BACFG|nr:hypothetical protein M124_3107 [Bacteroides fragilis str. 3988T(B)14]